MKVVFLKDSLAIFSIITPHHIDQPQPTKQNNTVNSCPQPIIKSIRKAPILGLGPSFWENLGFPRHKQNIPLNAVPKNTGFH